MEDLDLMKGITEHPAVVWYTNDGDIYNGGKCIAKGEMFMEGGRLGLLIDIAAKNTVSFYFND
jgi:hypothetical protein